MKKRHTKGFTLLEVLISVSILSIGMSFLFSIFPLGIRISSEVRRLGSISFFAQKKIEELKTMNETPSDSSGKEDLFNWSIKVEDFSAGNNFVLKKIQLDAEWMQGETVRRKSFVTYFK